MRHHKAFRAEQPAALLYPHAAQDCRPGAFDEGGKRCRHVPGGIVGRVVDYEAEFAS